MPIHVEQTEVEESQLSFRPCGTVEMNSRRACLSEFRSAAMKEWKYMSMSKDDARGRDCCLMEEFKEEGYCCCLKEIKKDPKSANHIEIVSMLRKRSNLL